MSGLTFKPCNISKKFVHSNGKKKLRNTKRWIKTNLMNNGKKSIEN